MKFIVKDLDIGTGGALIVILNEEDAERFDFHSEDRLLVVKGKRKETAILDTTPSSHIVLPGTIGLMDEMVDKMGLRNGDVVEIKHAKKPQSIQFIRDKLDGRPMTKEQIDEIISDISNNRLSEIEITYFVAATYVRGLSMDEIVTMTKSMVKHGDTLCLTEKKIMDKHCIGGVAGNRTTMLIVPIVTAAGLTIPKTSSRAITSPAGTADVMEVLANVEVDIEKLHKIVEKTRGCIIWGGSLDLAPADDKIIRVEKPLSIDAEGQLLASVMAKKFSVCATHVLIDIPVGPEAKIKTEKQAKRLKMLFERIGAMLGMVVRVIITEGIQPIGNGVGPALEARDVLWVLTNNEQAPQDLRQKAVMMAGHILEMGGAAERGQGIAMAEKLVSSGKAYEKMKEIIAAQGKRIDDPGDIKLGKNTHVVRAESAGTVLSINNKLISALARHCGCPKDKGAGLYIHKHINDRVRKDEPLFTLYSESREKLTHAKELLAEGSPYELT